MSSEAIDADAAPEAAALLTVAHASGSLEEDAALIETLQASLGDAVLALRLAGLHDFLDPKLLGLYAFSGTTRLRRPTVFRQTTVSLYGRHQVALTPAAMAAATEALERLSRCRGIVAAETLARLLDAFRSSFHSEFTPLHTCAQLSFATVEGLLGRFRPPQEKVQLEDLVGALAERDSADWFAQNGRNLRNDVAHGRYERINPPELAALRAVTGSTLNAYLAFWTDHDRREDHSGSTFIEHVQAGLAGGS